MRSVVLGGSAILWAGPLLALAQAPTFAQSFPSDAWGFSRTTSVTNQTITTQIIEESQSNRSGFAIAGENVTTVIPQQPISPQADFTIIEPLQQFNLGIDQFTPGPNNIKTTNQTTVTETQSRTFSVFQ
jgi:hypothetical protein